MRRVAAAFIAESSSKRQVLVVIALLTAFLAPGASASRSADHFSKVASDLARRPTSVTCQRLPGWLGIAEISTDQASARIRLARDVCATLSTRRVIEPPYPRPSTGQAVLVLAHESGHAYGLYDEEKAECFGLRNTARAALLLGYDASQVPMIQAQAANVSYCGKGL